MLVLILISVVSITAYFFLKVNYLYWERRGIRGPKPVPIIGNLGKTAFFLAPITNIYTKIYNDYDDEEIVGFYRGTTPTLLVRDPDLIKEIEIKNFSSFHDNDVYIDKKSNPLLGRNPFVLKGEEWKIVRSQLTPTFTTGKIKSMYPLLENVSTNLVKFIDDHPETTNGEGYEAKELCLRFTLNNVASCAFGLEGKCLEEEDSDFRKLSREFFTPDVFALFGLMVTFVFPGLSQYLTPRIMNKNVEKKLVDMISDTLKYRQEHGIVKKDFLDMMNELKKTSKEYEFTDVDVAAQAATILTDGSETSSVVMSFTLYHLAANPDAQKKLREEINCVQKLTYETLQSLNYLEATIYEAMRIHPPFGFIPKMCTKTFEFALKNEQKTVVVEKGTSVVIPVWGLQTDPKYFPEPESFKPERHLEENKHNLTKYTFSPFGEGPRACLGQRFAMLQVKIGVAYVIRNFEVSVNKKTKLPFNYVNSVSTMVEGGLWLDFKKIVN